MALQVSEAAEEAFRRILECLRATRQKAGLSQETLSARLLVRRGTVFEWETGAGRPTMRNLMLWSRELGLRLALLGPDGHERRGASKRIIGEAPEARELRRLAIPLRKTRLARRLSVVDLSKIIGMDRNSLLRWESARVTPRPMALIVWAQELDCSVVLRPIAAVDSRPEPGTDDRSTHDAAC